MKISTTYIALVIALYSTSLLQGAAAAPDQPKAGSTLTAETLDALIAKAIDNTSVACTMIYDDQEPCHNNHQDILLATGTLKSVLQGSGLRQLCDKVVSEYGECCSNDRIIQVIYKSNNVLEMIYISPEIFRVHTNLTIKDPGYYLVSDIGVEKIKDNTLIQEYIRANKKNFYMVTADKPLVIPLDSQRTTKWETRVLKCSSLEKNVTTTTLHFTAVDDAVTHTGITDGSRIDSLKKVLLGLNDIIKVRLNTEEYEKQVLAQYEIKAVKKYVQRDDHQEDLLMEYAKKAIEE